MTASAGVYAGKWQSYLSATVWNRISTLPPGISRLLLSDPTPHESQTELFRDACWLFRAGLSETDRADFLKYKFTEYYREITQREFDRALERSRNQDLKTGPKYPPKNPGELAKVLAENDGDLASLKAASPTPEPESLTTGIVIDLLFPGGGLLCLAPSLPTAITKARKEFAGKEHESQFMVPNLMSSEYGLTQDERLSHRTNNNVGPQAYQVIEFDTGTLDEQARIHLHLKSHGVPLVAVVFSGGKSLHAWFRVNKLGGSNLSKFLCYAAALGADRATFVPCQLVRTPNATRDNGAKQAVLYLDPRAGL